MSVQDRLGQGRRTSASDRSNVCDGLERAAELFDESRGRLFGIAYRMLGSVAEAEDIVQDAWLRWQQTDRSVVHNPVGFLTTITTRLAINYAESARVRREKYVGPWLPEPVDTADDPSLGAERAEALESATLVLLERLLPDQRAAYVLREAFDYSYESIAEILGTSKVNARQIVSRARKHVRSSRRLPVDPVKHREFLTAFVAAAQVGDVVRLEQLLAADVVSTSDGAGIVRLAARRPIVGRARVARFLASWADLWWTDASLTWVETNGRASLMVHQSGERAAVLSLAVSDAGIEQIMWVMAPEKLSRLIA